MFFRTLGFGTVTAPETNKEILAACKNCEAELCLPSKIYISELLYLADKGADMIFSPYYESIDKSIKPCPKFITINDLAALSLKRHLPIMQPLIELDKDDEHFSFESLFKDPTFSRQLSANTDKCRRAYNKAKQIMTVKDADVRRISFDAGIALIGHDYVLNNIFFMRPILAMLQKQHLGHVMPKDIPLEIWKKSFSSIELPQPLQWQAGLKIAGFSKYISERGNLSGAVYVSAFGCALDEVIEELSRNIFKSKGIPYLFLMLDEHTHPGSISIRMEAFLEICKKKT